MAAELAAFQAGATVINTWADIFTAQQNQKMQEDLAKFNNSMKAVTAGVQQYTNDLNRNALADAFANESIQITLDRMRAEAAIGVEAGATGATAVAQRAAMYDVDRNAVVAKFAREQQFESTLRQLKLQEFGQSISHIQGFQRAPKTAPGFLAGLSSTGLTLGKDAIEGGAFEKDGVGTKALSSIKNLLGGGSGVTIS